MGHGSWAGALLIVRQQQPSASLLLVDCLTSQCGPALDNVPTDVVQSKYFRAMLKSYDANADPPSINKVKDQFRVLEANIRQVKLLTMSGGFVTITLIIAKQSYCGMTAHWIDKHSKFHSS
jgi:hypothetical protein